jgi:hypothetical protein
MDGSEPGCEGLARLRHGLGPDEEVGTAKERIVSERTIAVRDVHGCSAALAALV